MKHLELALAEVGTVEWADGDNPKVVAYFRDSGNAGVKNDETAWCAAFVGAMLARAGLKPTGSLMARSYEKWGVAVGKADIQAGDVLVWPRGADKRFGHVNIAVEAPKAGKVRCVGGNQSDAVNVKTYALSGLVAARRVSKVERLVASKPTTKAVVVAEPAPQARQTPPTGVPLERAGEGSGGGVIALLLLSASAAVYGAWDWLASWF
jgi:uncharacterized protein (TIGR02594 family)